MTNTAEPNAAVTNAPEGGNWADAEHERESFQVGGVDRQLTQEEQLEQLGSYIDAHYPLPSFTPPWAGGDGDPDPADKWTALLPDRITHAAMLMLGSGLDHSMPGVAYGTAAGVTEVPEVSAALFTPPEPTGAWAVSLHSGGWWRGAGEALEMQWRPEVAAAAVLSGTTILDLDYPLAPEHTLPEMVAAVHRAADYARSHGATSVTVWGYSSGGALAVLSADTADTLVLTFPDLGSVAKLPDAVRGDVKLCTPETWPRTLVQIGRQDEVAERPEGIDGVAGITVAELVARHRIQTPEVTREKIRQVADFLRAVPTPD
ncbi:alpha/beta hydrolase [Corynebacterium atypicum]|uniref:alpha/beta hydrolase n=1 Tax=Corynebacterium atypicum TaxID=191610 RepID=UPI0009FBE959|nr:alpha/beta hydrolase [Corynebacterium atypicum]